MIQMILDSFLMLGLAYVVGFIFYGLYRNINARIQKRFGPPILQSFYDSIKLFGKKESIVFGWMFYLGPIIMATGAVITMVFIPILKDSVYLQGFSSYGNLIVLLYLMVLGPLGNALAVGATGNPFGAMGIVRGLTRLMALELPFYIVIIALMVANHSANIDVIMASQDGMWNIVAHPFLFIAAFISFVGFMGASPFDVVGAPTEVYSGPAVEFSGKFLGLLMSQSSIFSFAKLALMVDLFLGGATDLISFTLKAFALFVALIVVGNMYARFKTYQSVNFMVKIPTILAALGLLIIVSQGI